MSSKHFEPRYPFGRVRSTCYFLLLLVALPYQHANAEHFFLGRDYLSGRNKSLVDKLNIVAKPKFPTKVEFIPCGTSNAYYSPIDTTIVFCRELQYLILDKTVVTRPQKNEEMPQDKEQILSFLGAQYFILFHEGAHALIHQYKIPISGREEDVADQLSVWMMYSWGCPR